jgi:hypothetical protein
MTEQDYEVAPAAARAVERLIRAVQDGQAAFTIVATLAQQLAQQSSGHVTGMLGEQEDDLTNVEALRALAVPLQGHVTEVRRALATVGQNLDMLTDARALQRARAAELHAYLETRRPVLGPVLANLLLAGIVNGWGKPGPLFGLSVAAFFTELHSPEGGMVAAVRMLGPRRIVILQKVLAVVGVDESPAAG